MKLNIDIDNTTLDIISAKLKHTVKPLDILRWLTNFPKNEVKYAIDIISNITLYTTSEIIEILNENFNSLFENIKNNERIIVLPIGEFGKSGSMIAYYFQKTSFYKNNKKIISLLPNLDGFVYKNDHEYTLVLIDDFVGSGQTIEVYFTERIESKSQNFKRINFVGIAGMEMGINRIEEKFNKVEIPASNIFKKAFSSKASYFGYRKYSNHKKIAYEHGKKLTNPIKNKLRKEKYPHALGYNNSQALVSFAHGSPNNTLPIIWANQNGWFPIIPRFYSDKVSKSKNLRKVILHELSILKEFGSSNLQDNFFSLNIKKGRNSFSTVDKIDFSIYSVIKLTRMGYSDVSICQILGIFYTDYEEILQKGKERGVFKTDNILTLRGLELYKDAKKCLSKRKRDLEFESKESFPIKQIDYLPMSFNGKS